MGCCLVWDGCEGSIVELEAYAVEGDAACHTATRQGSREFFAGNSAGTAYVYLNYGMYWLLNVLVKGGGGDGILLIRAMEPTVAVDRMLERRPVERIEDLCSGPGKLGRALGIAGIDHGCPLTPEGWSDRGLATQRGFRPRPPGLDVEVITDVRVGISKAADRPWRFLWKGHSHLSVHPGKVRPPGRKTFPSDNSKSGRGSRSPRGLP